MQPTIESLTKEINQISRHIKAIMLEQHTPAYARSNEVRRAIDLHWKRANNLRRALQESGLPMTVQVNTIVPHEHKYVSGLNVPTNYHITCGKDQYNAFNRTKLKAKKGLVARNAG